MLYFSLNFLDFVIVIVYVSRLTRINSKKLCHFRSPILNLENKKASQGRNWPQNRPSRQQFLTYEADFWYEGSPGWQIITFHFMFKKKLIYLLLFLSFWEFFLLYSLLNMKAPVDRTKQHKDLKFGIKGLCRIANEYLSPFKKKEEKTPKMCNKSHK